MKILYQFEHKLKNGEKINLALRKPNRFEIDEADMMFSKFMSDCIRDGILTKEMLVKSIKNFGGILSSEEEKEYSKIFTGFVDAKSKLEKAKTKKEREALSGEIDIYYNSLRAIEMEHEALFARTADVIARNKTITHLSLLLGLKGEENKESGDIEWQPIFKGEDYRERYIDFAEQEEENEDIANEILSNINIFTTFWYFGDKSSTEADFKEYHLMVKSGFSEPQVT